MSGAVTLCRGEIVAGDLINFTEAVVERWTSVHGGGFDVAGKRSVRALVIKVSTSARGARTLTLEVRDSRGYEPLATGSKVRRQAAKLTQTEVTRTLWTDEAARLPLAAAARAAAPLAARAAEVQRTTSRDNSRLLADVTRQDEFLVVFDLIHDAIESYRPEGGGAS